MSPRRCVAFALLVVASTLALAPPAPAHNRSMSYSTWRFDEAGDAEVEMRLKLLELTRRPPDFPWTAALPGRLQLAIGDRLCAATDAERLPRAQVGWAVFRWRVTCDQSGPRAIHSNLLADVAVAHTHFARVELPGSESPSERVLITGRDPSWPLDSDEGEAEAEGTTVAGYIALGLEHILEGADHLAFVFALLLLSTTLREVVTLVTSFTLAHSLTLGLAVTGYLRPSGTAVEVLIGASIALVAVENGWLMAGHDRRIRIAATAAGVVGAAAAVALGGALAPVVWLGLALFTWCHFGLMAMSDRPARLRAAVAFGFGLIHGLGFAGILMEIELPAERLLPALFGFNVGVELGQLAVVALVWPILRALSRVRDGALERLVCEAGSAAVLAIGLYWTVARNWS